MGTRKADKIVPCFLEILDRRGLSENTVVIFCADHGEQLLDHGLVDKLVMYEGALRIPLVIHLLCSSCGSSVRS